MSLMKLKHTNDPDDPRPSHISLYTIEQNLDGALKRATYISDQFCSVIDKMVGSRPRATNPDNTKIAEATILAQLNHKTEQLYEKLLLIEQDLTSLLSGIGHEDYAKKENCEYNPHTAGSVDRFPPTNSMYGGSQLGRSGSVR